jgi:hypothetical protein
VVGFDTTILPGREGSITEEVSIAKVHDGPFTKCLTVSSNAKNKPQLQLCMKGVVKVPLAVSPSYAQMKRGKSGAFEVELTLSTEKSDLKVTEAVFTGGSGSSGQTPWQNTLPMHCEFKLTKSDTQTSGGVWEYKLLLTMNLEEKESKSGEFVIKTNHPESGEIKTPGTIDVSADQKK